MNVDEDIVVADIQPRIDAVLRRMQDKLEEMRRDLESRASRPDDRAAPGDPDEPIEGPTGL